MARTVRIIAGVIMAMTVCALMAFGANPTAYVEGKRLYETVCSGCHGKLEESAKGGRSTNRIRSAVRVQPTHRDLSSSLTDEDLLLIALVLKNVPE